MNKIRICVKGYPCGKSCISKTRKCWANLSTEKQRVFETFEQFVNRTLSSSDDGSPAVKELKNNQEKIKEGVKKVLDKYGIELQEPKKPDISSESLESTDEVLKRLQENLEKMRKLTDDVLKRNPPLGTDEEVKSPETGTDEEVKSPETGTNDKIKEVLDKYGIELQDTQKPELSPESLESTEKVVKELEDNLERMRKLAEDVLKRNPTLDDNKELDKIKEILEKYGIKLQDPQKPELPPEFLESTEKVLKELKDNLERMRKLAEDVLKRNPPLE